MVQCNKYRGFCKMARGLQASGFYDFLAKTWFSDCFRRRFPLQTQMVALDEDQLPYLFIGMANQHKRPSLTTNIRHQSIISMTPNTHLSPSITYPLNAFSWSFCSYSHQIKCNVVMFISGFLGFGRSRKSGWKYWKS